jgi:hypothetical protein
MYKKTASILVLLVLFFTLLPIGASAASSNNCSLSIRNLVVSPISGTGAFKVGFTGYVSGPVVRVQYTIINSKTGKMECQSASFCGKCTGTGVCSCSCYVSHPGTYDVKMTAISKTGCTVSTIKKTVIVAKAKPTLTPAFSYKMSGRTVRYYDYSKTGVSSWKWTFGDGYYSTAKNPVHTYKKAGTYKVCEIVYSSSAKTTKSICKTVTVK